MVTQQQLLSLHESMREWAFSADLETLFRNSGIPAKTVFRLREGRTPSWRTIMTFLRYQERAHGAENVNESVAAHGTEV
jgi:hypothetical protein